MKAYGIPRLISIEFPDRVDLIIFARPSHTGHLPEKSGCFKNNNRSSSAKRRIRRSWKKKSRNETKRELKYFNNTDHA